MMKIMRELPMILPRLRCPPNDSVNPSNFSIHWSINSRTPGRSPSRPWTPSFQISSTINATIQLLCPVRSILTRPTFSVMPSVMKCSTHSCNKIQLVLPQLLHHQISCQTCTIQSMKKDHFSAERLDRLRTRVLVLVMHHFTSNQLAAVQTTKTVNHSDLEKLAAADKSTRPLLCRK